MLVQVELKRMCADDLPLQVNYAAGRLQSIVLAK